MSKQVKMGWDIIIVALRLREHRKKLERTHEQVVEKLNISKFLKKIKQAFSTPVAMQDVQKGPLARAQPLRRGRSSKAAGPLACGAYTGVREQDKGPRTPLADFFNILLEFGS